MLPGGSFPPAAGGTVNRKSSCTSSPSYSIAIERVFFPGL